jgi:predicted AlkP superfamily pyrophosphatase or phosphodiesterase
VRVVIISIDGLRADAVQQAPMPNVQALAQRGAYTFGAQTIFPPVTLPSHTSMLTGQPPEAHGVLWNDYEPARGTITATTIFESAHNAGLRTVMVAGKEKFKHFEVPGTLDAFVFATGGDKDVLAQAAQQQFDLMFVHLPNPDFFGHSTGWMSETYLFQLTRTDERLGEFLNALPPDVAVILSADHGGLGLTHGQNIPEDMTIPWIVAGPGVKQNYAITGAVSTMDTAATALYLLGLEVPEEIVGKVVEEAFSTE